MTTIRVPTEFRRAWGSDSWREPELDAAREAALPELRAMLDRFLQSQTGLVAFAKESQDFSMAKQHWGFKGFAQMQLNQYAKVAQAAGMVPETERVLRLALRAPADDDQARVAFRELGQLTQRLVDEASRLGVGKPAPGRVPLVVSYFWEAQHRDEWPMQYPASKRILTKYGLFREAQDPGESYIAFRHAIHDVAHELGGTAWEVEHLLWSFDQQKPALPQLAPGPVKPPAAGSDALADIYDAYRRQGLIYPDEVVTSFLLSLWTKPFVILTGITGTGKTKIAQGLAQALEPGVIAAPTASLPALELGDEHHAFFRLTEFALSRGRLYVGEDQLEAFSVPERGTSTKISLTLDDGGTGALRLNNIDLSATPRELRLLFADKPTRTLLQKEARAGDVLRLEFDAPDHARATVQREGGADGTARRHLLLPVRADWSDGRGLLGFWNPIKSAYERTQVIDLLLRAGNDPAHPYFLILDEMNLARVEYYFADFLSAMESGEPIPLYADDGEDDLVPPKLGLPSNLFVVGTVNVDETTHAFSPKVLDRASVIEFHTVRILDALSGAVPEVPGETGFRLAIPALDTRTFKRVDAAARAALRAELVQSDSPFVDRLNNLHGLLEPHHRHFGYRVIDEIATFVGLARSRVSTNEATFTTAFDLAVCQKVLPKLSGGRELEEPLKRLLAFFVDPEDFAGNRWRDAMERYQEAVEARRAGTPSQLEYPRAAAKVARMIKLLADTGFVSFLE
jgi:hypothetical protein